jgi:hypothetical protein
MIRCVAFVRAGSGDWGVEISGGTAPRFTQPKPAPIEVFAGGENVRQLAAGYESVKKEDKAVVATAKVKGDGQIDEVKGTDPLDLNTITDRERIVVTMSKADGLSTDFTRTFAPYSANVLVLKDM